MIAWMPREGQRVYRSWCFCGRESSHIDVHLWLMAHTLHMFTDHQRVDIGLSIADSRGLLRLCQPYEVTEPECQHLD